MIRLLPIRSLGMGGTSSSLPDGVRVLPGSFKVETVGDSSRAELTVPDRESIATLGAARLCVLGEVYGETPSSLLQLYADGGLPRLTRLDGSYLLIVDDIDTGRTSILTDHIGSRAAYAWTTDEGVGVANCLREVADSTRAIDPAGVCSYLANDGTRAGLTPYAGVTSLPPGSITELGDAPRTERYWRIPVAPEDIETSAAASEMLSLMRQSVARRLSGFGDERIMLSLSGGVDSRGLLGLLLEQAPASRIETFTYFHGEQIADMDLPAAQLVAKRVGVRHQPVPGYSGDVVFSLMENAIRGDACAHFCDDADVWNRFGTYGQEVGPAVLVSGDRQGHHLGSLPDDLSVESLFGLVSLYPSDVIEWFLARLPHDVAEAMVAGWDSRFGALVQEFSGFESWRTASHAAYLELRLNPTLTLWRERFCRQVGPVISPYLDRNLLEFVGRLPTVMHDVEGAMLHRTVLEGAFPKVFSGGSVHGGWNIPDWGAEISKSHRTIRRLIERVDSRLGDLIPRGEVLRLLDDVASEPPRIAKSTSGWRWKLRKAVKSSPFLRNAVRSRRLNDRVRGRAVVDRATLLRRLLTLYFALSDPEDLPDEYEREK